jgi:hypothetical protein
LHDIVDNPWLETNIVFHKVVFGDDLFSELLFFLLLDINFDGGSINSLAKVLVREDVGDLVEEQFLQRDILVVGLVET